VTILVQAGIVAEVCPSLSELIVQLDAGARFVLVTEEALATADLAPVNAWLGAQEEWSGLPFVLLTTRGGIERNPAARRYPDVLGNVTFLEWPFHPTTLVRRLARSALRGRRRQYEARGRLMALRHSKASQCYRFPHRQAGHVGVGPNRQRRRAR
jgi:FixJ family two-component response regulator